MNEKFINLNKTLKKKYQQLSKSLIIKKHNINKKFSISINN